MKISIRELRSLIRESVIDASDRFKKKREEDHRKKISDLTQRGMEALVKQNEQEKAANAMLLEIQDIIERHISQRKFRLRFADHFREYELAANTTPYDLIGMSYESSDDWKRLTNFVRENAHNFLNAIAEAEKHLKDTEKELDSWTWLAPWRRYTKYSGVIFAFRRFVANVNKMLK